MSFIENTRGLRQREPRVRDKAHLGRVARLCCLPCLVRRGAVVRPVEVCHIRMGVPGVPGWRDVGGAEKPSDHRTYPACSACHRTARDAQHNMNEREFWEQLGIWPPALCAALVKAFGAGSDGMEVLRHFAAAALEQRKGRCPK